MTPKNPNHRWRFFRAGGLDQVRFDSAEDYRQLSHLDQKLWVALACPVKGLEFDEKTLALVDADKDGRVRVPEVIAAVDWVEVHLKDLAALKKGSDTLPLDDIRTDTDSGKGLLKSARQVLRNLGKPDASSIALADVIDPTRIFGETQFNGDSIVPADATADAALRQVIGEIIQTQGAETDLSGKPGVNQAKTDAFFAQLTALDAWARESEANAPTVQPLGAATTAAVEALKAARGKVDDFFGRCRLAAFDSRALAAVNRKEEEYLALAARDMAITAPEVTGFPLARIEAGRPLPLRAGLNPAWAAVLGTLESAVIVPLLGANKETLVEAEWAEIKAKLAPHEAWLAAKPTAPAAALGVARARAILATQAKSEIGKLIAQDQALEAEAKSIGNVERLIRYYRDLHRLLLNFTNFADFYDPEQIPSFQVGTLYLDGRACELCVRVDDPGKHAALAGLAKTYLAYCECTRISGEKMLIAAAFTDGDSDNLMIGRNGVFYDRKGRDWDATVTKIIENPISIRQAFWSPYKKLVRMIEEQVAKRAAAAEAEADAKLATAAKGATTVDQAKAKESRKVDVGTVAALGVAFGAIGTAFATVAGYLTDVFKMPFWQVVVALVGLLLIVSGPAMLIAWLKLRQRNLGPILDANGWAVNGRVKVPVSLGRSLTSIAKLPAGTLPSMDDKFADAPVFWPKLIAFAVAIGFILSLADDFGLIRKLSGGKIGSERRAAAGTNAVSGAKSGASAATNAPTAK